MSRDDGENEPGPSEDDLDSFDGFLRQVASAPESTVVSPPPDPEEISHFRILGRVGAGGMGVVFRAFDEKLAREVALKLLPASVAGEPERRRRLLREARLAALVTHANIATVYEIGEDDGRIFVAMELLEGETLRSRLKRGRLEVPEALATARAIAAALARAHARGVVHRDLKPENVMLDGSGGVKVLDFGLAKTHDDDAKTSTPSVLAIAETTLSPTEDGRVLGTPGYMAPEQAKGRKVDARADLFAFGVVVFEMLAGVRPFSGMSTFETMVAVERDSPPPLRTLVPDVPPQLESLVRRCLQKRPEDRPADARRVLGALDGMLATTPAHTTAWRTTAAWIGAVALVAVGAAAGWWLAPAAPMRSGPPAAASAKDARPPSVAQEPPALLGAQVARDHAGVDAAAAAPLPVQDALPRMLAPAAKAPPVNKPKPAISAAPPSAAASASPPAPDAAKHTPREIDTVAPY